MYMISLIEEYKEFGSESFETIHGGVYTVSAAKGIEKKIGIETFETLFTFEDIIDTNILRLHGGDDVYQVLVNRRNAKPQTFDVNNKEKAEEIVSLLDGYYRLIIDFYHYICQDCAPPSLVTLVKNRCHGPISLTKAKQKIEQTSHQNGTYLIRQNPEDFMSYCLTAYFNGQFKNFKMIIYPDGHVGLQDQPKFPNLRVLIDHYRNPDNCWCFDGPLRKQVPYQTKEDCLRLLDFSIATLPPPPEPEPAIEWIETANMSNRETWCKLGEGNFTSVYEGKAKIRRKTMRVAIKCPLEDAPSIIQQESRRIIHGKVSAHNVLVLKGIPRTRVKLGDPILSVYYHSLPINNEVKQKWAAWTAPELHKTNAEASLEGDKWSYGVTLWEIMSYGETPCANMSPQEITESYVAGRLLAKPPTCPELIYTVMKSCWLLNPAGRHSCKSILRDLNSLLHNSNLDGAQSGPYYASVMYDDDEDEPVDPIPEDLESLEEFPTMPTTEEEDNSANAQQDALNNASRMPLPAAARGAELVAPESSNFLKIMASQFGEPELPDIDSLNADKGMKFVCIDNIPEGKLVLSKQLGQGHFGFVFKGVLEVAQGCHREVAVKILKKAKEEEASFEQEILQLSRCNHKNIVKVLGYCESSISNSLQLVMEFVEMGSLDRYLESRKSQISQSTMFLFGQQICQGMAYLGEQRMVHRDLAARNILVASESEIKISDFGLARAFGEKDYYRRTDNSVLPVKWHAPESIDHGKCTTASDVWSFGVVLWEIFSYGKVPVYRYHDGKEVSSPQLGDELIRGVRLEPPPNCPKIIVQMMTICWTYDFKGKPTFKELGDRLGTLVD